MICDISRVKYIRGRKDGAKAKNVRIEACALVPCLSKQSERTKQVQGGDAKGFFPEKACRVAQQGVHTLFPRSQEPVLEVLACSYLCGSIRTSFE